jgi:hypothetical protein
MARRLKNALVAPVLQYVPEAIPIVKPGAIRAVAGLRRILDAAARSLKATASPTSCSSETAAATRRA